MVQASLQDVAQPSEPGRHAPEGLAAATAVMTAFGAKLDRRVLIRGAQVEQDGAVGVDSSG